MISLFQKMTTKMNQYEQKIKKSVIMNDMHIPKKNDSIHSFHQNGKRKTSWYLSGWKTMLSQNTPSNPDIVTYRSKIYPYHGLHRCLLTTVTPNIKVKEPKIYKIKFCDDLFINMINDFRLVFNEVEIQYANRASLKFDLKKSYLWDNMKFDIGECFEWGSSIPPVDLAIYPSFCYALDKSSYFPLQICGIQDDLSHVFNFNLSLKNLLLARKLIEGEWVDVPFNMDMVEVEGNLKQIPVPEMEGLYTTLTNEECKYNICMGDDGKIPEYYVETGIYYIEEDRKSMSENEVKLSFDSEKTRPVKIIEWGVINISKTESTKNLSFDTEDGITLVDETSLETSIEPVFRNVKSYKTENAYHILDKHYYNPGMNKWENNVLLDEDPRKFSPVVPFDGGSITIKKNIIENCFAFVILRTVSRYRFISYPKTQEERLKKGAIIEEG